MPKNSGMNLLEIYLNDHLAAATGARELVKRAASSNRDRSYGAFLERLALAIEEDRNSLLEIMRRLEVGVDQLKVMGGWAAEKLGRFKLNGRLLGYSPLSRVVELEILGLGITGKLALWRTLERLSAQKPALAEVDLPDLVRRAESQLDELERQRLAAALEAFS